MVCIYWYKGGLLPYGALKQRRGGELLPTISAVIAAQVPKMVAVVL